MSEGVSFLFSLNQSYFSHQQGITTSRTARNPRLLCLKFPRPQLFLKYSNQPIWAPTTRNYCTIHAHYFHPTCSLDCWQNAGWVHRLIQLVLKQKSRFIFCLGELYSFTALVLTFFTILILDVNNTWSCCPILAWFYALHCCHTIGWLEY